MDHQSWYNQRYSTRKYSQEAAEGYQKKLDEYQAIRDYNKAKKVQNLASAQMVFQEHGIPYEVRGNAWLVNVAGEELYLYPKSNKWKPKGSDTTYNSRGAADFLGKVVKHQLEKKKESLKKMGINI